MITSTQKSSRPMRVVLAYAAQSDVRRLRRVLLGAGLECLAGDCVAREALGTRLAEGDADLVVVETAAEETLDWQGLREALRLTTAPVLAVGPAGRDEVEKEARQAGVLDYLYLDEADLRDSLDAILDRIMTTSETTSELARQRGSVISVFAPTPGSGGSTVAMNLAGAMAKDRPQQVALVELARERGDLAALLNVAPKQTLREVCQRWQQLDTTSLATGFLEHPSGVRLLVSAEEPSERDFLHRDAVRRIAVLARIAFGRTVLALDSRLGSEELEAMRLSDKVVLVVRADVPAVRRARWALDRAVAEGVPRERFRLVVNRWGQGGQLSLKQVEESLGLKPFQLIQDDPLRVNRAANQGVLLRELSPRTTISRQFAKLAAALNGK